MKKLVLWVLLCLSCILLCACGDGAEPKTEHTHSFTDTVVLPSCTEGYTIHACMLCGYSYTDTYTPANGHSFLRTVNDCACDVRLEEQYACSVCGYSYAVTSEQFGAQHSFDVKEKVSATRETEGYTVYVCSLCGEMKEGILFHPRSFPWD